MNKIGVLLPRSSFYASMSFDIVEGLRTGLKQIQREDIELVFENIGFGAEKQVCYQAAENLLIKENVQIVIAYIGHRTAQLLRPLFMSANRLLIVLDAGSNMPQEWPSCPNIIYHSLNDSLACWLNSKIAGRDGFVNGGMVTGYYDGGYLHTFAATKSYVDSGSEIKFNHATGYTQESFSMEALNQHLEKNPESCLLSIFSADYTHWYFDSLNKQVGDKPRIYASSFMLEETMLQQMTFPDLKVTGVVAWTKELKNNENIKFLEAMEEGGREANVFALLAWEAASIVAKSLDLLKEDKKVPLTVQKLTDFEFMSPRGKISFNKQNNQTLSPMYEVELARDESGMSKLNVKKELSEVHEEFTEMSLCDLNGSVSGWYNSYTCI